MRKNYQELAAQILPLVGGKENIIRVYHCQTRLRFTLADESKADDKALEALDGVRKVIRNAGVYQVVIGTDVADLFAVGLGKALHLPVLPVEGADYPHPFQRLEEELVQPVDLAAQRHRVAGHQQDDDPRAQNEGGDSQVQHRAQLAPCQGGEDQPRHRHQRGGDPQPQQQREEHLDVGHVGGTAGHQAGSAEPLHFSSGKALHLVEDLMPQIGSKAGGHLCREDGGRHIEHTAQNGQGSHHRRHYHNGAAALARHTHVDHAGQGGGQQHTGHRREKHQGQQGGHALAAEPDPGKDGSHTFSFQPVFRGDSLDRRLSE